MSSKQDTIRQETFDAVSRELRLSSSLAILHSQAVAERLGVHSTDIETIDLLNIFGPMTAGQLAEKTGLTTGATTRLIDRMERAGFVRRRTDPRDRRRVVVEGCDDKADDVLPLFEPVMRAVEHLCGQYTQEELGLILDFMRRANELMDAANRDLRQGER